MRYASPLARMSSREPKSGSSAGSDGVLSVHLATDNAASFQTLVGAQESLKARLGSFEKDVRVEVISERGGAEAESGDGRRQSRGEYVVPDERDV